MLEDKAEGDKAPKPGFTSPQSSILDFFISPNKGKPTKKVTLPEDDVASSDSEIRGAENKEEQTDILVQDHKEEVMNQNDESADSVILLSDETSTPCGDPVTEKELLNVSGISSEKKCSDRDFEGQEESDSIFHQISADSKSSHEKKCLSSRTLSAVTETKTVNLEKDVSFTNNEHEVLKVDTLSETAQVKESKCDETKKDQPVKKKRKRKSSENADRKKSKIDPDIEEVSVDLNCTSTEMSYEAFIQSLSTPGRDTTVDVTSPDKDSQQSEEPEILDVKQTVKLLDDKNVDIMDEDKTTKVALNEDSEMAGAKKTVIMEDVLNTKKTVTSKCKVVRTALFHEGSKQTVNTGVDELGVSSGDDAEKTKKPTILNFFSKINSPGNSDKEHQVVTVLADIHHQPPKEQVSPPQVKSHGPRNVSPKSPGVVEIEEGIEIIGSETVLDDSNRKRSSKLKKKTTKDKSGNKKNEDSIAKAESKDDVKIEKVEVPQRAAEVNAFLKSSDNPIVPLKSAQATLSFTKTGLKATPSTVAPHNTRVRSEADSNSAVEVADDIRKEKDVPKKRKKNDKTKKTGSKKKCEEENTSLDLSDAIESPEPERRSRRVKYQVSSLQFDDSQQTPIKMKIRLKKNSSGEESDFTPKSSKMKGQKQQKAQKLLEKAKKVKKSKTSKTKDSGKRKDKYTSRDKDDSVIDLDSSTDTGTGGRRRSARLAVQSPPVPIVLDDEEEEPEQKQTVKPAKATKTPLKLKPKDSPKKLKAKNSPLKIAKDSPRKQRIKNSPLKLAKDSPRKQKGKLAPIFGGKSKTEPEKPKEPEDPEKVRLRQAFLMSDVPELLKRKVVATAAVQNVWESVGLPTISHIQQKPSTKENVWNLPAVQLPLRKWEPLQFNPVQGTDLACHSVISLNKTDLFKDFRCHSDLSVPIVEELLGEMEAGVKGLSPRQMYSDMQQKLQDDLRSQDNTADITDKASQAEANAKSAQEEADKKKKGRGRGKGAAEKGVKGRKKLSLSKDVEEKEVVESSPVPEIKKVGEMMWSERYQPSHSTEIIGHTGHIQKLKSWLLEWKHRTHKEARKMRLQMLKQTHSKSTVKDDHADNAWWGEDDSDFDLDSDDSEDEDDSLCNTMLITGPHGIGKTATVYALAQELGYKVIEVNAASSRNGKKILSKLQEATQSHQVATSKDGGSSNMLSALSNSMSNSGMALGSPKPAKKEAKLPTAFTNLFRKAGGIKTEPLEIIDVDAEEKRKKKQGSPTKSKRKRKREKEDESVEKTPKKAKKEKSKVLPLQVRDDTSQSGGLELSSTTLILFDEVEIFFEDDRGYIPAIQHFMTRTKIPIILTTTDSNFGNQLQARCESLVFRQPSLVSIASRLQTICLVENVRTCPEEMLSLVRLHRGDIRKCLLWLQYWLSSGGGSTKRHQHVRVKPRPVLPSGDENTCSQDSLTNSQDKPVAASQDDDDDFVISKTTVSRKRRVLDDDESSCSNVFPTEVSQSESNRSSHLPQVHCLNLETTAGVSQPVQEELEKVFQSYLKGECDQHKTYKLQELCENLHRIGLSVVSQNLYHLLPLPKMGLHTVPSQSNKPENTQNKRSRIRTDLFDDEASNDSAPETQEKKSESDVSKPEVQKDSKNEYSLNYKCLKAFSNYYDSMSSIDLVEMSAEQCLFSKCYSGHMATTDSKTGSLEGEKRVDCAAQDSDSTVMSLVEESRVLIEIGSAKQLYRSIVEAVDCHRTEASQEALPETASLPVSGAQTTFSLLSSEPKLPGAIKKAHENVRDCLPMMTHCSQYLVHMDYLPSLRAICRAEHHRQIAKTKRRFHHYFDNIGLSLKESSLNALCQTFD